MWVSSILSADPKVNDRQRWDGGLDKSDDGVW